MYYYETKQKYVLEVFLPNRKQPSAVPTHYGTCTHKIYLKCDKCTTDFEPFMLATYCDKSFLIFSQNSIIIAATSKSSKTSKDNIYAIKNGSFKLSYSAIKQNTDLKL